MMKKTRGIAIGLCVGTMLFAGAFNKAEVAAAEPGSSGDPIISKSYVDARITEVKELINEVKALVNVQGTSSGGTTTVSLDGLCTKEYVQEELTDLEDMIREVRNMVQSGAYGTNSNTNSNANIDTGTSNISKDEIVSEVLSVVNALYGDALSQQGGSTSVVTTGQSAFTPLLLERGKILVGGEGAEIIFRSGQAMAYSENSMGLVDVTDGTELLMGTTLTKNHLLLVARDDGRGVYAETDSWFMVKGSYKIK